MYVYTCVCNVCMYVSYIYICVENERERESETMIDWSVMISCAVFMLLQQVRASQ